ncbi:hypothetical protein pv_346 [Pithovirus sibericum]|uniref:Uncharacterized protein n=1 Tax=Pithovirus sibericum TaxID=1450746 RepID=W5S569_9VIRU|nr:hypothetical protein pv_346 [Pithovirus sibericum]AHH01913.1 hypothetical protein pv_346 [Pithovirus sibericum]
MVASRTYENDLYVAFNGEDLFDLIENELSSLNGEIGVYQVSPGVSEWKGVDAYEEFEKVVNYEDLWYKIENQEDPEIVPLMSKLSQRLKNQEEFLEFNVPDRSFLYICSSCQFASDEKPSFSPDNPCEDDECTCSHFCGCNQLEKIDLQRYSSTQRNAETTD